jgi:serine/threonine protein kinase
VNIFVYGTGHARITYFGLAVVTQDVGSIRSASIEHSHSIWWIAPEILDGRGTYGKEADVFSFDNPVADTEANLLDRIGH